MRMAVAKSGKCPVCDPDQANQVSAHADAELERIDAVLAGADSRWEGVEWRADGSHQDDELAPWQESFLSRRIFPHSNNQCDLLPAGLPYADAIQEVMSLALRTNDNPLTLMAPGQVWMIPAETSPDFGTIEPEAGGWTSVGGLVDGSVVFGFDGSRDDDAISFAALHRNITVHMDMAPFPPSVLTLLWGDDTWRDDPHQTMRWEDDGGPVTGAY